MIENAHELYDIGYNYYVGRNGYPLNYYKAFEYLSKSAEAGISNAINVLGVMYLNGTGVNIDIQKSINLFNKAINIDNNIFASYNLACLYFDGIKVPKEPEKAFRLFHIVIDNGYCGHNEMYSLSCFNAGCIMISLYRDNKKAIWYFEESLKYDNIPEAWHNLGCLCEKRAMNVKLNQIPQTALSYYLKAAELGYVVSMDSAARMYMLFHMNNEARYWLEKAVALGYKPAKIRLKALNYSESGSFLDFLR